MTHIYHEIMEPYSAQQMFDLVNDINAYPQFVPDCIDTGVLQRDDNLLLAYIEVEKFGFKKRFTTLNRLKEPSKIEITLIDGPFKKLIGAWTFTPISENQSKITFDLTFEFNSKLLDMTFTPIFKDIMKNMVIAFSNRAKQLYDR
ncbi:type II toxin-antitoxin system RatA family toxin [Frischella perrara]|uniref:Oligoketide cyclase/lipid transport protein n=1 Tax=Frischella perrara TaxID=1267021 RepID=A0A0A7RYT0_FRIPE|nr:type II toxin-antitoxin system RatA family toxin [Frischella perrara]AJA44475.1 Oligoketide cyclase/lipid transport protein [Frischella perrara]MCT6876503.1 type II toxin-antitoxin system RatA family toxin [Frischella perrara]PWV60979.1 ribosome-associated toxin RatA of RatAB toxin-antitoxin module [Frischella perrara]